MSNITAAIEPIPGSAPKSAVTTERICDTTDKRRSTLRMRSALSTVSGPVEGMSAILTMVCEVEDIPAAAEEPAPVDGKLSEHLEDEDGEHDPVDSDEEAARRLNCRCPGLEPESDSVEENHPGYEPGETRRFDQLTEPLDKRRIASA